MTAIGDTSDPELARIVEAWPKPPGPIRRAMVALVGDDADECDLRNRGGTP